MVKLKCPGCNKKAVKYVDGDYIFIRCAARVPCDYINKRKVYKD